MRRGLPLALCFPTPLLFLWESIHINEAGLSVFPTSACGIVELWNRREGCRPDSGSRSRRRRRRLQPCQFAVSWTVCENQPWPCRWALMMRTTTQTLSRLAHQTPAGRHSEATGGMLVPDRAVCSITGQWGNGATWREMSRFSLPSVLALWFLPFFCHLCVCMLVCFCQVKPAIGGGGCVYIAQSPRAAFGCFKSGMGIHIDAEDTYVRTCVTQNRLLCQYVLMKFIFNIVLC